MATIKGGSSPEPFEINNFLGLNPNSSLEVKLGEAEDTENYRITSDFNIKKREGYREYIYDTSDFPEFSGVSLTVKNKNQYGKLQLEDKEYLHAFGVISSVLYLVKISNNKIISKHSTAINGSVNFVFIKDNYLYFSVGDTYYFKFDGTNITAVSPTIPTTYLGVDPLTNNFASKAFQPTNILTKSRKISYIAQENDKRFNTLEKMTSITGITVNGVAEPYYTMYPGGYGFELTYYPFGGSIVELTYVADVTLKADLIYKCTKSMTYGGKQDIDIFLYGNENTPDVIYHSYNGDATYFAESGTRDFKEEVTGIVIQNTTQTIFGKTRIGSANTTIDDNGNVTYPITMINYQNGHDSNVEIQVVDNNPVFITKYGTILQLSTNTIRDERNVDFLSKYDMSKYLKSTSTITRAVLSTLDNEIKKEYMIFYSELKSGVTTYKALVYNYYNKTWYKFSNLTEPTTPVIIDGNLYLFSAKNSYFDDSFYCDTTSIGLTSIKAFYQFPYISFSKPFQKKAISLMGIGLQPNNDADSYERLEYSTNTNPVTQEIEFSLEKGLEPKILQSKISCKNIQYFKLKIISDTIYHKSEVINLVFYVFYGGLFN